jgi:hypothetical protein
MPKPKTKVKKPQTKTVANSNFEPKNQPQKTATVEFIGQKKVETSKEIPNNVLENKGSQNQTLNENSMQSKMKTWSNFVKGVCVVVGLSGLYDLYTNNTQNAILSFAVAIILWPNLIELNFKKANIWQRIAMVLFVCFYFFYLYRLIFRR